MNNKIFVALGPNVFVKEIQRENKIGDFYIPDSMDVDSTYQYGWYFNGNEYCSPIHIHDHGHQMVDSQFISPILLRISYTGLPRR